MLSPGAIAGIVIGSIIGLILLSLPLCCICYRRRLRHSHAVGAALPRPTLAQSQAELEEWASQPYPAPQQPWGSQQQSGGSYDSSAEPVNFGSMQVKGIADVREGRERDGVRY
ncbi:hypothetical protein HBI56_227110 [Parastagonospora nodorum]|uniref:Uncharacterized protein n=1 Tax=Phaeosphaeria nodorum (strain SN15 / ATCC MYA-4574 / FGSC 10173) TaxID=321614 RepID=A0A7U2F375_PHANO|nr:hypothetical protein HBH56_244720 [Parastagonospora nodorum]QRC95689.1 hypothetical protein JI435_158400 [Parastagonospora nodorum SN15]KAH3921045.1 hypothetical protein HBH54_246520 [Parastagonospora nodorum]KAH3939530.1 hypothetical protein HBH53_234160 [Parastagonospora nodorum]KAH3959103.1 hypothetical protein HBH51_202300 [Parastagonospora nodorum]